MRKWYKITGMIKIWSNITGMLSDEEMVQHDRYA